MIIGNVVFIMLTTNLHLILSLGVPHIEIIPYLCIYLFLLDTQRADDLKKLVVMFSTIHC